jgi:hypothetical protein
VRGLRCAAVPSDGLPVSTTCAQGHGNTAVLACGVWDSGGLTAAYYVVLQACCLASVVESGLAHCVVHAIPAVQQHLQTERGAIGYCGE